jgi:hypothetical protein
VALFPGPKSRKPNVCQEKKERSKLFSRHVFRRKSRLANSPVLQQTSSSSLPLALHWQPRSVLIPSHHPIGRRRREQIFSLLRQCLLEEQAAAASARLSPTLLLLRRLAKSADEGVWFFKDLTYSILEAGMHLVWILNKQTTAVLTMILRSLPICGKWKKGDAI